MIVGEGGNKSDWHKVYDTKKIQNFSKINVLAKCRIG
jgi:hypothetical protein